MCFPKQGNDRALCVVPAPPQVDLTAAESWQADFYERLALLRRAKAWRDTPARIARAYAELLAAEAFAPTTFPNLEGYDELVLARSIPFRSGRDHMLQFVGSAHVGYLPGERILGRSEWARAVGYFAARPQVQGRLTKQVADW